MVADNEKTILIIARHGNNFLKGQTPTRVGMRTDIPLVENEKGTKVGEYLRDNKLIPDVIYSSPLLRTMKTASLAIGAMKLKEIPIILSERFSEIDYGVDENKTEDEVCFRIGSESLKNDKISREEIIEEGKRIIDIWNNECIPPSGWIIDTKEIIKQWQDFGKEIEEKYFGKKILVVTSHGIAKFAPYLTKDAKDCYERFGTKLSTGGICIFSKMQNDDFWTCDAWGIKP